MKRLALSSLAGFLLALAPASSHAQHFSFGFSTGHHHHHRHHGHWHGPCWGPPWWGPSLGFVFAPPPVIQERVIYVQPPAPVSTWPPSHPAVSSIPAPAAATARLSSQITIRNASGTRLPVTFLIDGQDIELADGETRSFAGQTSRMIRYDRGGRFGSTEQELSSGNFEFRITATGWDLVRKPDLTPATRTAARANALPSEAAR